MPQKDFVFITRFYSGLFEIVGKEKWIPTGIPTLINLVDKLSKEYSVMWILLCKTEIESETIKYLKKSFILNNISFVVIPKKSPNTPIAVINKNLQLLYDFSLTNQYIKENRKAIFYIDRSNIGLGLLIKNWFRSKIVIRILGIYPSQKALASSLLYKLKNPVEALSYRTKFNLCIGTQDGSGTEYYLPRIINKRTKKEILLNGIEIIPKKRNRIDRRSINILFVGSLVESKGILEFVKVANILKVYRNKAHFTIVGKGYLENEIRSYIHEKSLNGFVSVKGALSKGGLNKLYCESDIYLSINKLGSLSNTVLEALSTGMCVLTLNSNPTLHIDEYTDHFIPEDVMQRIDRDNIVDDLQNRLSLLLDNPNRIDQYSKKALDFARRNLWTWEERIQYEITLLSRL